MKGIRKVVSATKGLRSGYHVEIGYNDELDLVVTSDWLSSGSYVVWEDKRVETVCRAYRQVTMEEVREAVNYYLWHGITVIIY